MIIIYKFSNAAGETIYVGATAHLNKRLTTHRREKPWWDEIAAIHVEMIDGIQPAADRETHLIRTIKPRYNSQNAGRYYGPLGRRTTRPVSTHQTTYVTPISSCR